MQDSSHGRSAGKTIGGIPPKEAGRPDFQTILTQNGHQRFNPAKNRDGRAKRDFEDFTADL